MEPDRRWAAAEKGRIAGLREDYPRLTPGQRNEQAIRFSHELTIEFVLVGGLAVNAHG